MGQEGILHSGVILYQHCRGLPQWEYAGQGNTGRLHSEKFPYGSASFCELRVRGNYHLTSRRISGIFQVLIKHQ
jgi:hypothetical protein